jgi:hypothetical protein
MTFIVVESQFFCQRGYSSYQVHGKKGSFLKPGRTEAVLKLGENQI